MDRTAPLHPTRVRAPGSVWFVSLIAAGLWSASVARAAKESVQGGASAPDGNGAQEGKPENGKDGKDGKDAKDAKVGKEGEPKPAGEAKPEARKDETPKPETTPVPRYVVFPPLRHKALPGGPAAGTVSVEGPRYTLACLLGTWNAPSKAVAQWMAAQVGAMRARGVASVALFSHDTPEAVAAWVAQNKPPHFAAPAADALIDALRNPKIPSCYVVNFRGELAARVETPAQDDLAALSAKLILWTDF